MENHLCLGLDVLGEVVHGLRAIIHGRHSWASYENVEFRNSH